MSGRPEDWTRADLIERMENDCNALIHVHQAGGLGYRAHNVLEKAIISMTAGANVLAASSPSTPVQTAVPTFNETGDALKVERLRKLAADLDRFASAIYDDYSQSDLWSTLCAARVEVLATLTKNASHG